MEAYPYFKYAAKYGDIAEAWHNLGYLTEKGYVPSNIPASQKDSFAKGFYERAAELGYTPSMLVVGRLYTSHNMANEGKFWVERAAALGNEQAKKCCRDYHIFGKTNITNNTREIRRCKNLYFYNALVGQRALSS